jgi:N-acetylglucosamine-6-phosphate deacetylase
MIRLNNCRLADRSHPVDIYLAEGLISRIEASDGRPPMVGGQEISAQGRLVTPGLIDVHTQGAGGAEVLAGSQDGLRQMARTLALQGTTGFLATTVVQKETANTHLADVAAFMRLQSGAGAQCHGIHLEGPYINVKRKGGIGVENIFSASDKSLADILALCDGALAMMTIAPELVGHLQIIRELVNKKVIASLGHTDASFEEACAGFDAGITHVTHLFNAMPPLHHRAPGALTAVLNHKTVTAHIISDGVHLHGQIINMIYRLLEKERCVLITDGMQATGLPDGRYHYDGKEYETKSGTARYLDGTLIGSTLSMMEIALRFKTFTGCSMQTAVDCASLHPARLLGLEDRKGSIAPGKDADIVVWNDDFSVHAVLIDGKKV